MQTVISKQDLKQKFITVRERTATICSSLKVDDYSVQPIDFVSPPKWHLGHTTWFFEQFVLVPNYKEYKPFSKDFAYYFNSYYNNVGERILRMDRGNMTRPTISEVYDYRSYVNSHLNQFLNQEVDKSVLELIQIGLQHEQQHQELLIYDIKYIFGHQPAFPVLHTDIELTKESQTNFKTIQEGVYEIGHKGSGFCFDNELGVHKVYLNEFQISNSLVTTKEYIEFIEDGGYSNFNLWHADGWDWIKTNKIKTPMYWHNVNDIWKQYTLKGIRELDVNLPVSHISFYEAWAFAEWKGMRLPTEFEWEIASQTLNYGQLWEWTNSAYLPYPKFKKAEGAIGEYNGKFMVNAMVMRGASIATPKQHSRPTYRNFFSPETRWQFSGIRLAK